MSAIRALLVDDEEPARCRLRALLDEFPDIEVVGEAADGEEALLRIREHVPQLVFIDIQMPGRTGLEVAAALEPPRPSVIFCTAYDKYAVDAFEHHAVDYLLKPLNRKRLAVAVERVRETVGRRRRLDAELQDASATQARLLPQGVPRLDTLDFAGRCRPAREIGGDYYDFLALGSGKLGLAVGDVSGKGLFAGLLVAKLQATVQSIAPRTGRCLGDLVGEVNRLMAVNLASNRYATFFYGEYDDRSRELSYVNAGHPPALLVRAGNPDRIETLPANGTVVGLLRDATYRPDSVTLRPGDLLAVYSDGVTEAADAAGEEFGEERLIGALRQYREGPAAVALEHVLAAVDGFRGDVPPADDLTLVLGRVR